MFLYTTTRRLKLNWRDSGGYGVELISLSRHNDTIPQNSINEKLLHGFWIEL
jgi:hypothetical protein